MFRLGGDLQVYLHREPIDFRAGINSLAVLVQETMALDPFTPAVFAFCNRRCDRMKLLFFDRSGFVLVLKRLTEDKFRWPRRQEAVVTLTTGSFRCRPTTSAMSRNGTPSSPTPCNRAPAGAASRAKRKRFAASSRCTAGQRSDSSPS